MIRSPGGVFRTCSESELGFRPSERGYNGRCRPQRLRHFAVPRLAKPPPPSRPNSSLPIILTPPPPPSTLIQSGVTPPPFLPLPPSPQPHFCNTLGEKGGEEGRWFSALMGGVGRTKGEINCSPRLFPSHVTPPFPSFPPLGLASPPPFSPPPIAAPPGFCTISARTAVRTSSGAAKPRGKRWGGWEMTASVRGKKAFASFGGAGGNQAGDGVAMLCRCLTTFRFDTYCL